MKELLGIVSIKGCSSLSRSALRACLARDYTNRWMRLGYCGGQYGGAGVFKGFNKKFVV
jgi:hypothetical protein